jgi:hypothetical protein
MRTMWKLAAIPGACSLINGAVHRLNSGPPFDYVVKAGQPPGS